MDFLNLFSDDVINECRHEVARRQKCIRCCRPVSVCICCHLPETPIKLKRTKIYILQHPDEIKRPLNTVAILKASINSDDCIVYRAKKFPSKLFPNLHEILYQKNTFILYPDKSATDLANLDKLEHTNYNFVLIDGTWKQARSIYAQNKFLHNLPKVAINQEIISEYVIRTQPKDQFLSTIECAAIALSCTEPQNFKEILMRPLRELCKFQLDNGAVVHVSKEAVSRQLKENLPELDEKL